jgi:ubiquinone/menaquinone biosynthesis C-methylase UbiE
MERVLEPELMDDPAQAEAYAAADFDASNSLFVELFRARFPDYPGGGAILDLGCGPGDIALRLAAAFPATEVHGLDGAGAMLSLAEAAAAAAGEAGQRVRFIQGLVPGATLPRARYDAIVSNSLLHHLHHPETLWDSVHQLGQPGAPVLIMDLARPADEAAARTLVDTYAAGDPEVLRTDFHNSLLAAFEPDEVRAQLAAAGLPFEVATVSDRHLAAWGRLPGA